MSRAENRHNERKFKKKAHPASKCSKAKCMVCSGAKVLGIPNRQQLREKTKNKQQ